MADVVERSPEMVRLVYFLHQYARVGPAGRTSPPAEFGDATWREVYEQFFPRLGAGRTFETFRGSAEGLRKGNISEHKANGTPLLPKYEEILRGWAGRARDEQWVDLQQYREAAPRRTADEPRGRAAGEVEVATAGQEEPPESPGGHPPSLPEASDLAEPPPRQEFTTSRVVRDTALAQRVKAMHGYRCQVCGEAIELPDGTLYAEGHHIRPLGRPHDGPDVEGNILCVCPNHHAELDFAARPINPSELRTAEGHAVGPEYVRYHNEVLRSRWQGTG